MTYIITIERKGYRFDIELQSPNKAVAIRTIIEGFKNHPDPDSKLIAIKEQA